MATQGDDDDYLTQVGKAMDGLNVRIRPAGRWDIAASALAWSEGWLTVESAAGRLSVSRQRVYQLIDEDRLVARRLLDDDLRPIATVVSFASVVLYQLQRRLGSLPVREGGLK